MKLLSLYFGGSQVFWAEMEAKPNGMYLNHINSTSKPIILDIPEDNPDINQEASEELCNMLTQLEKPNHVLVSLLSNELTISYFPGDIAMPREDIEALVDLELVNLFPDKSKDDFTILVYDLAERMDGNKMLMALLIPNEKLRVIRETLDFMDMPISKVNISMFTAQNSLLFNYPDYREKAVAAIEINDDYVEISVLNEGTPLYLSRVKHEAAAEIPAILEAEFNKIMTHYISYIETAFIGGIYLTYDLLQACEAKLAEFLMTCVKLNTFKRIRPNVSDREKSYCKNTSHIFPPCIGAALPSSAKYIVL